MFCTNMFKEGGWGETAVKTEWRHWSDLWPSGDTTGTLFAMGHRKGRRRRGDREEWQHYAHSSYTLDIKETPVCLTPVEERKVSISPFKMYHWLYIDYIWTKHWLYMDYINYMDYILTIFGLYIDYILYS